MKTNSSEISDIWQLIHQFLQHEVAAEEFCTKVIAFWSLGRDHAYNKQKLWPEPYDQQLITAWQRGELTEEAFRAKWDQLWDSDESTPFRSMLDRMHSACYVFRPYPHMEWEINEDQLRQEIILSVEQFKASSSRIPSSEA